MKNNVISDKNIYPILKNKKFYLCPYNNLTKDNFQYLKSYKGFLGYIDNYKTGINVFSIDGIQDYDYVVIASPNYKHILSKLFEEEKVLALDKNNINTFQFHKHKYSFDVLFLVYNKSNVTDASLVIRELNKKNHSAAIIETNTADTSNLREGLNSNKDINYINFDKLHLTKFKTLVCAADWINREFILRCKANNIKTIGMVDGIEDFHDTDYQFDRKAYQTVEYVLLAGKNNLNYFKNKRDKCFIVGLPKIYHLWKTEVSFPKEQMILINLNFTYGVFEEYRESWLNDVIDVIKSLKLKYQISQHHADNGKIDSKFLSMDNVYEAITNSTLVVSRFSTIISESLSLGKPVVYYNPHKEKSPIYNNPQNAFSISKNKESLKKMIIKEILESKNVRKRATKFLNNHFNILSPIPHAEIASNKIIEITELNDE